MLSVHQVASTAPGYGVLDVEDIGTLHLAWEKDALLMLSFDRPRPPRDISLPSPSSEIPSMFVRPLRAFFAGDPVNVALLPVRFIGTAFECKVWRALQEIPRGAVRSYAGIALDVGSPQAMRAVGSANRKNPIAIVVPCHRVVTSGFHLGGYSGGLERKKKLLKLEGVTVADGLVQPGQMSLLS